MLIGAEMYHRAFASDFDGTLADVPRGHVWPGSRNLVRLRPGSRRVPHIRHLHKYLHGPFPAHKRFRFRDGLGFLNLEAASLVEIIQLIPTLPIESLGYHQPGIVCEEKFPVPEEAIWLEQGEVRNGDGTAVIIPVPHVIRDRCIGCGICEDKCSVNGDAAIRVHVPGGPLPQMSFRGAPTLAPHYLELSG